MKKDTRPIVIVFSPNGMPDLRRRMIAQVLELYPGANANIQQRVNMPVSRKDQIEDCKAIMVLEEDMDKIGVTFKRHGYRVHIFQDGVEEPVSPVADPPLGSGEPDLEITNLTPQITSAGVDPVQAPDGGGDPSAVDPATDEPDGGGDPSANEPETTQESNPTPPRTAAPRGPAGAGKKAAPKRNGGAKRAPRNKSK